MRARRKPLPFVKAGETLRGDGMRGKRLRGLGAPGPEVRAK